MANTTLIFECAGMKRCWAGTFHSDASDLIHPGERTTVVLIPLYEIDYSALRPVVEFDVLEGPQVAGAGTVE